MLERNKTRGRGFQGLSRPNQEEVSMTKKVALAFALALGLVPALVLAADSATHGRPTPDQILRNPRLLARYLHLTADQNAQARPLYQTLASTLEGLRGQEQPLAQQLRTLLDGSSPGACDVGALVVQIDSLHDQAHAAQQTFDSAFSALLTPDQLARYEALKDAAHVGDDEDSTPPGA
jgi:Spy/CpxP family protein refolding chaperone